MPISRIKSLTSWPREARAVFAWRSAARVVPWARAYIPKERLKEIDLAIEVIEEVLSTESPPTEDAQRLAVEAIAVRKVVEDRVLAGFPTWYRKLAAESGMDSDAAQHVVDLVSCALHSLAAAAYCAAAVHADDVDDQNSFASAEGASQSASQAASCVDFLRRHRGVEDSVNEDPAALVLTLTLRAGLDDLELLDSASPEGTNWREFLEGAPLGDPWIRARLDDAFAKAMDPDSWASG